ncbi:hypothetical protein VQ042_25435 [Aurantimonas sp. A2-1-M11]|uniref:hypothetical protein n=1 Tax=Aurantimonas sp. A2-1-M11 TaxID=3113712 RepID=UPI002F9543F8
MPDKRVENLKRWMRHFQEQRDWLLSLDWADDRGGAQQTADEIAKTIALYQKLIERRQTQISGHD